jgi:hypothetical protein
MADVDRLLAAFTHTPPLRSNAHAASFLRQQAPKRSERQKAVLKKFLTREGNENIQSTLRAGDKDTPDIKDLRGMMVPLEHDLILSRVVGPDAFGLRAEDMDGVEEWSGQRMMDPGFSPMNIGDAYQIAGPHIEMRVLVPRGTPAIIVGADGNSDADSRTVILPDGLAVQNIKIQSDGRGGWYAMSVVGSQQGVGKSPQALAGRPLKATEKAPAIDATPDELERRGISPEEAGIPAPQEQPGRFGPTTPSPGAGQRVLPQAAPGPEPAGPSIPNPAAGGVRKATPIPADEVPLGAGKVVGPDTEITPRKKITPRPSNQVVDEDVAQAADAKKVAAAADREAKAREARRVAAEKVVADREARMERERAEIAAERAQVSEQKTQIIDQQQKLLETLIAQQGGGEGGGTRAADLTPAQKKAVKGRVRPEGTTDEDRRQQELVRQIDAEEAAAAAQPAKKGIKKAAKAAPEAASEAAPEPAKTAKKVAKKAAPRVNHVGTQIRKDKFKNLQAGDVVEVPPRNGRPARQATVDFVDRDGNIHFTDNSTITGDVGTIRVVSQGTLKPTPAVRARMQRASDRAAAGLTPNETLLAVAAGKITPEQAAKNLENKLMDARKLQLQLGDFAPPELAKAIEGIEKVVRELRAQEAPSPEAAKKTTAAMKRAAKKIAADREAGGEEVPLEAVRETPATKRAAAKAARSIKKAASTPGPELLDETRPDAENINEVRQAKSLADINAIAATHKIQIPKSVGRREDRRAFLEKALAMRDGESKADYDARIEGLGAPAKKAVNPLVNARQRLKAGEDPAAVARSLRSRANALDRSLRVEGAPGADSDWRKRTEQRVTAMRKMIAELEGTPEAPAAKKAATKVAKAAPAKKVAAKVAKAAPEKKAVPAKRALPDREAQDADAKLQDYAEELNKTLTPAQKSQLDKANLSNTTTRQYYESRRSGDSHAKALRGAKAEQARLREQFEKENAPIVPGSAKKAAKKVAPEKAAPAKVAAKAIKKATPARVAEKPVITRATPVSKMDDDAVVAEAAKIEGAPETPRQRAIARRAALINTRRERVQAREQVQAARTAEAEARKATAAAKKEAAAARLDAANARKEAAAAKKAAAAAKKAAPEKKVAKAPAKKVVKAAPEKKAVPAKAPAKKVAAKAAPEKAAPAKKVAKAAPAKAAKAATEKPVITRKATTKAAAPEAPPAKAAPTAAPGTAARRITALRAVPGTRVMVAKRSDGSYGSAPRKTGAIPIEVTALDRVGGGRGGRSRLRITGTDPDGNQVQLDVSPSQTFPLEAAPAKKAAKAIKKAVPAKAAPERPVKVLRKSAAKKAPASAFDRADVMSRLQNFENPPSRKDATSLLEPASRADLLAMAKEISIPGASRKTSPELRREVVEATAGRRLDSIAIRGFRGERPGEAGVPEERAVRRAKPEAPVAKKVTPAAKKVAKAAPVKKVAAKATPEKTAPAKKVTKAAPEKPVITRKATTKAAPTKAATPAKKVAAKKVAPAPKQSLAEYTEQTRAGMGPLHEKQVHGLRSGLSESSVEEYYKRRQAGETHTAALRHAHVAQGKVNAERAKERAKINKESVAKLTGEQRAALVEFRDSHVDGLNSRQASQVRKLATGNDEVYWARRRAGAEHLEAMKGLGEAPAAKKVAKAAKKAIPEVPAAAKKAPAKAIKKAAPEKPFDFTRATTDEIEAAVEDGRLKTIGDSNRINFKASAIDRASRDLGRDDAAEVKRLRDLARRVSEVAQPSTEEQEENARRFKKSQQRNALIAKRLSDRGITSPSLDEMRAEALLIDAEEKAASAKAVRAPAKAIKKAAPERPVITRAAAKKAAATEAPTKVALKRKGPGTRPAPTDEQIREAMTPRMKQQFEGLDDAGTAKYLESRRSGENHTASLREAKKVAAPAAKKVPAKAIKKAAPEKPVITRATPVSKMDDDAVIAEAAKIEGAPATPRERAISRKAGLINARRERAAAKAAKAAAPAKAAKAPAKKAVTALAEPKKPMAGYRDTGEIVPEANREGLHVSPQKWGGYGVYDGKQSRVEADYKTEATARRRVRELQAGDTVKAIIPKERTARQKAADKKEADRQNALARAAGRGPEVEAPAAKKAPAKAIKKSAPEKVTPAKATKVAKAAPAKEAVAKTVPEKATVAKAAPGKPVIKRASKKATATRGITEAEKKAPPAKVGAARPEAAAATVRPVDSWSPGDGMDTSLYLSLQQSLGKAKLGNLNTLDRETRVSARHQNVPAAYQALRADLAGSPDLQSRLDRWYRGTFKPAGKGDDLTRPRMRPAVKAAEATKATRTPRKVVPSTPAADAKIRATLAKLKPQGKEDVLASMTPEQRKAVEEAVDRADARLAARKATKAAKAVAPEVSTPTAAKKTATAKKVAKAAPEKPTVKRAAKKVAAQAEAPAAAPAKKAARPLIKRQGKAVTAAEARKESALEAVRGHDMGRRTDNETLGQYRVIERNLQSGDYTPVQAKGAARREAQLWRRQARAIEADKGLSADEKLTGRSRALSAGENYDKLADAIAESQTRDRIEAKRFGEAPAAAPSKRVAKAAPTKAAAKAAPEKPVIKRAAKKTAPEAPLTDREARAAQRAGRTPAPETAKQKAAKAEIARKAKATQARIEAERKADDKAHAAFFRPILKDAGVKDSELSDLDRTGLRVVGDKLRDGKISKATAARRLRTDREDSPLNKIADAIEAKPRKAAVKKAAPEAPTKAAKAPAKAVKKTVPATATAEKKPTITRRVKKVAPAEAPAAKKAETPAKKVAAPTKAATKTVPAKKAAPIKKTATKAAPAKATAKLTRKPTDVDQKTIDSLNNDQISQINDLSPDSQDAYWARRNRGIGHDSAWRSVPKGDIEALRRPSQPGREGEARPVGNAESVEALRRPTITRSGTGSRRLTEDEKDDVLRQAADAKTANPNWPVTREDRDLAREAAEIQEARASTGRAVKATKKVAPKEVVKKVAPNVIKTRERRAKQYDEAVGDVPGERGGLLRSTKKALAEGEPAATAKDRLSKRAESLRTQAELLREKGDSDFVGDEITKLERDADTYQRAADLAGKKVPTIKKAVKPGEKVAVKDLTDGDVAILDGKRGTFRQPRPRTTFIEFPDGSQEKVQKSRLAQMVRDKKLQLLGGDHRANAPEGGAPEAPAAKKARPSIKRAPATAAADAPGNARDRKRLDATGNRDAVKARADELVQDGKTSPAAWRQALDEAEAPEERSTRRRLTGPVGGEGNVDTSLESRRARRAVSRGVTTPGGESQVVPLKRAAKKATPEAAAPEKPVIERAAKKVAAPEVAELAKATKAAAAKKSVKKATPEAPTKAVKKAVPAKKAAPEAPAAAKKAPAKAIKKAAPEKPVIKRAAKKVAAAPAPVKAVPAKRAPIKKAAPETPAAAAERRLTPRLSELQQRQVEGMSPAGARKYWERRAEGNDHADAVAGIPHRRPIGTRSGPLAGPARSHDAHTQRAMEGLDKFQSSLSEPQAAQLDETLGLHKTAAARRKAKLDYWANRGAGDSHTAALKKVTPEGADTPKAVRPTITRAAAKKAEAGPPSRKAVSELRASERNAKYGPDGPSHIDLSRVGEGIDLGDDQSILDEAQAKLNRGETPRMVAKGLDDHANGILTHGIYVHGAYQAREKTGIPEIDAGKPARAAENEAELKKYRDRSDRLKELAEKLRGTRRPVARKATTAAPAKAAKAAPIKAAPTKRVAGQRRVSPWDPIPVFRDGGESGLRDRLSELDTEQLKDMIAAGGMDSSGLAAKWRSRDRLTNLIVDRVQGRATKGRAFRPEPATKVAKAPARSIKKATPAVAETPAVKKAVKAVKKTAAEVAPEAPAKKTAAAKKAARKTIPEKLPTGAADLVRLGKEHGILGADELSPEALRDALTAKRKDPNLVPIASELIPQEIRDASPEKLRAIAKVGGFELEGDTADELRLDLIRKAITSAARERLEGRSARKKAAPAKAIKKATPTKAPAKAATKAVPAAKKVAAKAVEKPVIKRAAKKVTPPEERSRIRTAAPETKNAMDVNVGDVIRLPQDQRLREPGEVVRVQRMGRIVRITRDDGKVAQLLPRSKVELAELPNNQDRVARRAGLPTSEERAVRRATPEGPATPAKKTATAPAKKAAAAPTKKAAPAKATPVAAKKATAPAKAAPTKAAPAKKVAAKKAVEPAEKFLPPLADGTQRKSLTNVKVGDTIRVGNNPGDLGVPQRVTKVERDGNDVKITRADGSVMRGSPNTAVWMGDTLRPGERSGSKATRPTITRAAKKAAPEAGAPEATPAKKAIRKATPAKTTAARKELDENQVGSTPARNMVKDANRDLSRGDSRQEVADRLRGNAEELRSGDPLTSSDMPDRIDRSDADMREIALIDARRLDSLADDVERGPAAPAKKTIRKAPAKKATATPTGTKSSPELDTMQRDRERLNNRIRRYENKRNTEGEPGSVEKRLIGERDALDTKILAEKERLNPDGLERVEGRELYDLARTNDVSTFLTPDMVRDELRKKGIKAPAKKAGVRKVSAAKKAAPEAPEAPAAKKARPTITRAADRKAFPEAPGNLKDKRRLDNVKDDDKAAVRTRATELRDNDKKTPAAAWKQALDEHEAEKARRDMEVLQRGGYRDDGQVPAKKTAATKRAPAKVIQLAPKSTPTDENDKIGQVIDDLNAKKITKKTAVKRLRDEGTIEANDLADGLEGKEIGAGRAAKAAAKAAKKATPKAATAVPYSRVQTGDKASWTDADGNKVSGTVQRMPRGVWVDWESGRRERISSRPGHNGVTFERGNAPEKPVIKRATKAAAPTKAAPERPVIKRATKKAAPEAPTPAAEAERKLSPRLLPGQRRQLEAMTPADREKYWARRADGANHADAIGGDARAQRALDGKERFEARLNDRQKGQVNDLPSEEQTDYWNHRESGDSHTAAFRKVSMARRAGAAEKSTPAAAKKAEPAAVAKKTPAKPTITRAAKKTAAPEAPVKATKAAEAPAAPARSRTKFTPSQVELLRRIEKGHIDADADLSTQEKRDLNRLSRHGLVRTDMVQKGQKKVARNTISADGRDELKKIDAPAPAKKTAAKTAAKATPEAPAKKAAAPAKKAATPAKKATTPTTPVKTATSKVTEPTDAATTARDRLAGRQKEARIRKATGAVDLAANMLNAAEAFRNGDNPDGFKRTVRQDLQGKTPGDLKNPRDTHAAGWEALKKAMGPESEWDTPEKLDVRLRSALQDMGIRVDNNYGDRLTFDPDTMNAFDGANIGPGDEVTVVRPGLSYRDKDGTLHVLRPPTVTRRRGGDTDTGPLAPDGGPPPRKAVPATSRPRIHNGSARYDQDGNLVGSTSKGAQFRLDQIIDVNDPDFPDDGIPVRGFRAHGYDVKEGRLTRHDGVLYLTEEGDGPKDKEHRERTLKQVQEWQDSLPENEKKYVKSISSFSGNSPGDSYWQQRRGLQDMVASASAGNGEISIWRHGGDYGHGSNPATLDHELGHLIDDRYQYSGDGRWEHAGQSDNIGLKGRAPGFSGFNRLSDEEADTGGRDTYRYGISRYGTSDTGEDFAEAYSAYKRGWVGTIDDPDNPGRRRKVHFRELYPARAAIFDGLFPERGVAQRREIAEYMARDPDLRELTDFHEDFLAQGLLHKKTLPELRAIAKKVGRSKYGATREGLMRHILEGTRGPQYRPRSGMYDTLKRLGTRDAAQERMKAYSPSLLRELLHELDVESPGRRRSREEKTTAILDKLYPQAPAPAKKAVAKEAAAPAAKAVKKAAPAKLTPARLRRAQHAAAEELAKTAADLEENIDKGASDRALLQLVRTRLARLKIKDVGDEYVWQRPGGDVRLESDLTPTEDADILSARRLAGLGRAVQQNINDRSAMRTAIRKNLAEHELTPIGAAGDKVKYDPAIHQPMRSLPKGTAVQVVHPGYQWRTPEGTSETILRPLVMEAPSPRKVTGAAKPTIKRAAKKAAPSAKAAPEKPTIKRAAKKAAPTERPRLRQAETEPTVLTGQQGRITSDMGPRINTGPEGIPARDYTLRSGYHVDNGTFYRIDKIPYLIEHDDTPEGKAYADGVQKALQAHRVSLPLERRRLQRSYAWVRGRNPKDVEAAHRRGLNPDKWLSDATSDSMGGITVYNRDEFGFEGVDQTLDHEFAHSFDHADTQAGLVGASSPEWLDAAASDNVHRATLSDVTFDQGPGANSTIRLEKAKPHPEIEGHFPDGATDYALVDSAEDFAEAFRLYRAGPIGKGRRTKGGPIEPLWFRDVFPARAAIFDEKLPDFAERQLRQIEQARGGDLSTAQRRALIRKLIKERDNSERSIAFRELAKSAPPERARRRPAPEPAPVQPTRRRSLRSPSSSQSPSSARPAGRTASERQEIEDLIRGESTDRVPRARVRDGRLTGRVGILDRLNETLRADTGPEGILVHDLELQNINGYKVRNGRAWRFNGVTYLLEDGADPVKSAELMDAIYAEHNALPAEMRGFQRAYALLQHPDATDAYEDAKARMEARRLGNPRPKPSTWQTLAAARGGDIYIFRLGEPATQLTPIDRVTKTVRHEGGHNLDNQGHDSGLGPISSSSSWSAATRPTAQPVFDFDQNDRGSISPIRFAPNDDAPFPGGVTNYGTASPSEDFAEAVALYTAGIIGRGRLTENGPIVDIYFRDLFPERAAELDRYMPNFGADQMASIRRLRS